MVDRLRPLWDFDDLDASEQRFRAQLEQEESDAGRAEVLTQVARVHGLRDDFVGCAKTLDEADALAGSSAAARIRIELERGRMHRSSGASEAALPLFESAFTRASVAGEYYLAGDAAHMCALAVPNREAMEEWTQRGLELGEREPAAAYWSGPLLNNLGWSYYDSGEYERALEFFERALEVRERDPDNQPAIAHAREAVETTLEALGKT
jgi:tetratricopeptide (TPR) repeat protein